MQEWYFRDKQIRDKIVGREHEFYAITVNCSFCRGRDVSAPEERMNEPTTAAEPQMNVTARSCADR